MTTQHGEADGLTRKDFVSSQEVKWCPGCVDYSILAQMQKLLPALGIPKENHVFVSGIGCSSRFPYYVDTFGLHGIHGRAPAIATGLKLARPELCVWVVTGDGDALAIGGNHFIHAMRRNVGLKILLFNNRIYGLTKGQISPTSEMGKRTKTTPFGSVEHPVEPVSLAIGMGATFVARAVGSDGAMLGEVLRRAARHEGTAVVEILSNCVIFNDGAFDELTAADSKSERQLRLVHGEPLRFGKDLQKGLALDDRGRVVVVDQGGLVHDQESETLAFLLARLGPPEFPMAFGVFRDVARPTFESLVRRQEQHAGGERPSNVADLLASGDVWTVA